MPGQIKSSSEDELYWNALLILFYSGTNVKENEREDFRPF